MNTPIKKNLTQNVGEFERVASVVSGLLLVGKAVRRGGLGGILQFAIGSMALARGFTGHCEAKRIFNEALEEKQAKAAIDQRYSHMPMDSEVHSPDFESSAVILPDATPMGHEKQAGARGTPSANS
ncbi:YgaP family membrane protein [Halopseudomonas pelagia]|uniref:YgaP family membrane protein n=1 Tax=Halopseudomonas pelagia TaxID=553151 RepID=UPI0003A17E82|nr:DUF2892 domain-containing protein [Halopseudomonas pelagia]|tara:strand:- start:59 stop:436 length:378 start_codon:yes stop_codon:yes gene_type:complete